MTNKIVVDKEIRISFKTPDVLDCLNEAVQIKDENGHLCHKAIEQELSYEVEDKIEALKKKLSRWIEYGENVTLIYNVEKDTLTVA